MPSTPEPHEQWYVLHVLSGQENSVRDRIIRKAKDAELSDFIYRVEVPTELISEVRNGKKTERHSKLFPGYVYANMYLLEADGTLNKDLWYFIQQIDGVISIAGSRNAPLPMRSARWRIFCPCWMRKPSPPVPRWNSPSAIPCASAKARSRARKAPSKKSTPKKANCASASPSLAAPLRWTWNTGRWKKPEPHSPAGSKLLPFIFSANKAKPWQKK